MAGADEMILNEQSPPVPVLCVGATAQGGSTLLSRMLGQVPGLIAVGETARVWDKGLIENMECGCGASLRSCGFRAQVGEEAFGGWDAVDAREATRLRDRLTLRGGAPHPLALPLILWGQGEPSSEPRVRRSPAKSTEKWTRIILAFVQLPSSQRRLVTGLALPFLHRYGYLAPDRLA